MDAEKIAFELLQLASVVQLAMDRRLSRAKLRTASYLVLKALAETRAERLSITQISTALTANQPDVARMVDRLQAIGYVKRFRDETSDRRMVFVQISDSGREAYEYAVDMLSSCTREQVDGAIAKALPRLADAVGV